MTSSIKPAQSSKKLQLDWTEMQQYTLLLCIHGEGGHLNGSSVIWNKINRNFFTQPIMLPLKADYFNSDEKDGSRKLKNQYSKVKKEAEEYMKTGNKSDQTSAEVNRVYKLIEQMISEIEEQEATKQREKQRAAEKQQNEDDILASLQGKSTKKTTATSKKFNGIVYYQNEHILKYNI